MVAQSAQAAVSGVFVPTVNSLDKEYITGSICITNPMIATSCQLSGDGNAIHSDKNINVAPGMLLLLLASGLVEQTHAMNGLPMFRELIRWKFQRPVLTGDSIHLLFRVVDNQPTSQPNLSIVTINVKMLNQNGDAVGTGKWELSIRT